MLVGAVRSDRMWTANRLRESQVIERERDFVSFGRVPCPERVAAFLVERARVAHRHVGIHVGYYSFMTDFWNALSRCGGRFWRKRPSYLLIMMFIIITKMVQEINCRFASLNASSVR